ncbi:MAG: hypothetical protein IPK25_09450 [Saprospiraceae bacterium]|nr:hypothetical protein [Saprospiraceae bacterium]
MRVVLTLQQYRCRILGISENVTLISIMISGFHLLLRLQEPFISKVKSDFPNLLAVYEGTCTELNSVYCSFPDNIIARFCNPGRFEFRELYYIRIGSSVINGKSLSGNICLEISDNEPQFTRLQLEVTRGCQSRELLRFLPDASGGNGNYTYYGFRTPKPCIGKSQTYVIE